MSSANIHKIQRNKKHGYGVNYLEQSTRKIQRQYVSNKRSVLERTRNLTRETGGSMRKMQICNRGPCTIIEKRDFIRYLKRRLYKKVLEIKMKRRGANASRPD